MAKSLKIQIEMAGAEEIKRQLEGVGEAGEKAFDKIIAKAKDVGGFKNLDPGAAGQAMEDFGVKGEASINKITTAVKSATKMETLVNALTGVENGLAKVQSAASAVDNVLGKALLSSITRIARFLPAAFAAATVGSIANTTKSILELDAAAIKLGVSVGDLSKAQKAFEGIGLGAKEAAKGVGDFFEKLNLETVNRIIEQFKTLVTFSGLDALERISRGTGEAAELARKTLAEMGKAANKAGSDAARAIDDIKKSAASLPDQMIAIIGVLEKMGNTAERDRLIFANFDKDFGARLIQILNAGIPLTAELVRGLAGVTPVTQEAANAATRLSLEWEKFKNMLASGFTISPEGLDQLRQILQIIREVVVAVGQGLVVVGEFLMQFETIQGMMAFGSTLRELQQILQLLTSIGNLGVSIWKNIETGAVAVWKTIVGWIETAIEKVRDFFGMGGGQAQGAGAQGMARGGMIGGRGTGTSDSNLAWLSRGEHIMPARAVRQPGVLQLLEALRRSGGNLRGVLDRMGHFALGGMVSAPAFARGGAVGGMSHVTIQFPGVQPITGLRASSAVVDELRRSAALAQVRSGGRKPSRYS